jgi:colanic acid/amylovoran biosynthesis glycosyltransferase
MRVLLVGGPFPLLSETFIVAHFRGLLARGIDVHYWGSEGDAWDGFPGLAEEARGRLHAHAPREQPARSARDLLAGAASPRVLAAARGQSPGEATRRLVAGARVARLRPDLIHFEFGVAARETMWMGDIARCPMVVSFRGYDLNYTGLDEPGYFDEVWRRADAIHCLGEDLWQRAQRRGCPAGMRHALIAPAVDTARFAPHDDVRRDGPLVILTVARLHWKKGHVYGLQAVRELVDAGVELEYRIVGTGPHADAVHAAVRDLALTDHVRLLGAVRHDGVREEMRAADLLLHPAVSEGFGNAVMEAQAAGLPIVCTDADGLRENIVDGETGFAVARRDPAALAAALTRLTDPELRARMGAAARRNVAARFQPERQIDAFVALYEETLGRARWGRRTAAG